MNYRRDERPEYVRQINQLKAELASVSSALGSERMFLDSVHSEVAKLRIEKESLQTQISQMLRKLAQLDLDHASHTNRVHDIVIEHERLMSEHSDKIQSVVSNIAQASVDLEALRTKHKEFKTLSTQFSDLEAEIGNLRKQREELTTSTDERLTAVEAREQEAHKLESDIDAKIEENGRILRDISIVRSDIYVYAGRLQKYYDHVGLKIQVEEILNHRMPKE